MTEYYSPENMKKIVPYVRRTPEWLLLGGPADAREAQTALEIWPNIRVVGVEPNEGAVKFQLENGWPDGHPLWWAGLSNQLGTGLFDVGPDLRHSHVGWGKGLVPLIRWDDLDADCGRFDRAILWMDIEGSEYRALQGAEMLFRRNAIDLVNVEVMGPKDGKNVKQVKEFLSDHGFVHVKDWNDSDECRGMVWVKE